MRINIGIIKIHIITNIGSLNVGKTILCNNRATVAMRPVPADTGETPAPAGPSAPPRDTPQGSDISP